jgi:hypothetical protein
MIWWQKVLIAPLCHVCGSTTCWNRYFWWQMIPITLAEGWWLNV